MNSLNNIFFFYLSILLISGFDIHKSIDSLQLNTYDNKPTNNYTEATEATSLLNKILKDIVQEIKSLRKNASQEFNKCESEYEDLDCKKKDFWLEEIRILNETLTKTHEEVENLTNRTEQLTNEAKENISQIEKEIQSKNETLQKINIDLSIINKLLDLIEKHYAKKNDEETGEGLEDLVFAQFQQSEFKDLINLEDIKTESISTSLAPLIQKILLSKNSSNEERQIINKVKKLLLKLKFTLNNQAKKLIKEINKLQIQIKVIEFKLNNETDHLKQRITKLNKKIENDENKKMENEKKIKDCENGLDNLEICKKKKKDYEETISGVRKEKNLIEKVLEFMDQLD